MYKDGFALHFRTQPGFIVHRFHVSYVQNWLAQHADPSLVLVRGPSAEPGKWVQSFFLNVFMLYRYCTL